MLVAALVVFKLPAAAVMIYASLRPLWAGSAHTDHAGLERTYRSIAIRAVIFVLALQALIVLNLSGLDWLRPIAPRAVVVLFGLFVIAIGDALPRTRPNYFFGIRTARTLDDRQFWIRLHRVAGYLAVAAGAAIAIAGAFFAKDVVGWVVSTSALGGTATLAALYAGSLPAMELTAEARVARRRQIALWIVRVLLAALFFYLGVAKFPGSPRRMWVRLFANIGLGQWFRIFTGFVEAGGAILLLVPRGAVPAAILLGCAMVGALLVHVFVIGVGFPTVIVCLLLAMLIGVGLASRT
jgi:putative oxidoreductase